MHAQSDGKPGVGKKPKTSYSNPFRLLLIVAASVFLAEAMIMFFFSSFYFMTGFKEAVLDALLLLLLIIPVLYVFFYKPFLFDIEEREKAEMEKDAAIAKLEKAIAEIKVLKGFIPICANCKKIRDDAGYWQHVETYIRDRSEIEFSHAICPDCSKKLYPEFS
jgi:hypothetical protein